MAVVTALLDSRGAAILCAQWRTIINFYRRPQMGGYWFGTAVMVIWYLMVAGLGAGISFALGKVRPSEFAQFEFVLTFGLLAAFLYWQVVPVFLASTGMSLDTRKLMVYPVPRSQLFLIEVMLRFSTGVEVLIVLCSVFVGLLRNPEIPVWAPFTLAIFVVFNLYLSAGIKDLIARLMERKGLREVAVLLMVLAMVSPQMIALIGLPPALKHAVMGFNQSTLPWGAAAALAMGKNVRFSLPLVLAWTGFAIWFGRGRYPGMEERHRLRVGRMCCFNGRDGCFQIRWRRWWKRKCRAWRGVPGFGWSFSWALRLDLSCGCRWCLGRRFAAAMGLAVGSCRITF